MHGCMNGRTAIHKGQSRRAVGRDLWENTIRFMNKKVKCHMSQKTGELLASKLCLSLDIKPGCP